MMLLSAMATHAKSVVFTLNDKVSTRVYVLLDGETYPKLVMNDDGTFTLCNQQYEFSNVKNFYISATDYEGEKNTVDAIVSISHDKMTIDGQVSVYSLDGTLVTKGEKELVMKNLKKGTYVMTNGQTTLKVRINK